MEKSLPPLRAATPGAQPPPAAPSTSSERARVEEGCLLGSEATFLFKVGKKLNGFHTPPQPSLPAVAAKGSAAVAPTAGEGLPSPCNPARFPRRSPFHLGHSGAVDLSAWELTFWRQDCSSEPCIRAGSHHVFHKSLGFLRRPDGPISATAPQELRIRAAPCKSRL